MEKRGVRRVAGRYVARRILKLTRNSVCVVEGSLSVKECEIKHGKVELTGLKEHQQRIWLPQCKYGCRLEDLLRTGDLNGYISRS